MTVSSLSTKPQNLSNLKKSNSKERQSMNCTQNIKQCNTCHCKLRRREKRVEKLLEEIMVENSQFGKNPTTFRSKTFAEI